MSRKNIILLSMLFPWLSFFLRAKALPGLVCLILQCTLVGWIPASLWAIYSLENISARRRVREIERRLINQSTTAY